MSLGDEFGRQWIPSRDSALPEEAFEQVGVFRQGGMTWTRREFEPVVNQYLAAPADMGPRLLDILEAGLNPVPSWMPFRDFLESPAFRDVDCDWSSANDGELMVVTLRMRVPKFPGGTYQWWLDPRRGHAITRTRVTNDRDGTTFETKLEYTTVDGIPFVSRVITSVPGRDDPVSDVECIAIEVNRPEHSQTLTPADIGVEPGMMVVRTDQAGFGVWDGNAVVPAAEFGERVSAGTAAISPGFARLHRMIQERTAGIAREEGLTEESIKDELSFASTQAPDIRAVRSRMESDWEKYTRIFVRRHDLDAAQTERCWTILRDCQAQAHSYLDRKRAEISELIQRLQSPVSTPKSPGSQPGSPTKAQLEQLLKPVVDIFEEQLKPRLDRIPTSKQRAAAVAASQPAGR